MHVEEIKNSICRIEGCKTPHGFVALLVVLMVSLNAVVVIFQAISFCLDGHTMREQGDAPKIFIESFHVVGKLVSYKAYLSALFLPAKKLLEAELLDVLEQGLRACCIISFAG